MPTIKTLVERKRGCGYRKKGGLYLIGSTSFTAACCKLPLPLTTCKCCGQGIRFSRGFSWISPELFDVTSCSVYKGDRNYRFTKEETQMCGLIDMYLNSSYLGLMWVGESFYKTPQHFINEANSIGISKRIAQIPRNAKPGKTWIALAHKKAIFQNGAVGGNYAVKGFYQPGIFMLFKLQSIQYVVTGKETNEELELIEARGAELVNVIPEGKQLIIE